MFYDSGQAWHHGASAYSAAHANLNPPLVVAVLFHPLSFLPYPIIPRHVAPSIASARSVPA